MISDARQLHTYSLAVTCLLLRGVFSNPSPFSRWLGFLLLNRKSYLHIVETSSSSDTHAQYFLLGCVLSFCLLHSVRNSFFFFLPERSFMTNIIIPLPPPTGLLFPECEHCINEISALWKLLSLILHLRHDTRTSHRMSCISPFAPHYR